MLGNNKKMKKMDDMDLGYKGSALKEFDTKGAFGEKKFRKANFLRDM